MRLRILKRHIDKATMLVKDDVTSIGRICPIAQAIKERKYDQIWVTTEWVSAQLNQKPQKFLLQEDAKNLVSQFDKCQVIKPQTITLKQVS